jgi:hypothetical protein
MRTSNGKAAPNALRAVVIGVLALGVGVLTLRGRHPQPAPSAAAASLDLARLPADTQVIARLDVTKPQAARIWQKLVERMASSDEGAARISASCRAEVLTRVESMVLSSGQELGDVRKDYAVVVHGNFEQKTLERCAEELSKDLGTPREADGHVFYPGAADKWLAVVSSKAVVLGTFDRVKGVVAAFDGRGPLATADRIPELVGWQDAIVKQPFMLGARLPEGYATKQFASQALLATVLDVKSFLLTADIESGDIVLRARLSANDPKRAEDIRTGVARLVKMAFMNNGKSEDIAQVRGSTVEAKVALTKQQGDSIAARFKL